MKQRNITKAQRIGETYATHLFRDMQKGYAGPKFTWQAFPRMVARLAEAGLFLEFSGNTKHLPKLEKTCRRAAYRKAKELASKLI